MSETAWLRTEYGISNRARLFQEAVGTANVTSLPAPVGGINARDSDDLMPPMDARQLTNWYVDGDHVRVRDGFAHWSAGVSSAAVETLIEFRDADTDQLLAAGDGKLVNVTTAGSPSDIASGFSSNFWQGENFAGYLTLVNGEDAPRYWNGSTLSTGSWTGAGLTAANLIDVHNYTSRLFFVEKDTSAYWYGAVGNVTGGTLNKVDLGQITRRGSSLATIKSLSVDGGEDIRDYIAFIFFSGEVLVYQGTDPSDATAWALYGRYYVSPLVSRRAVIEDMGDVVVLTKNGPVSLSEVMKTGSVDRMDQHPVYGKIRPLFRDYVKLYGNNTGWEATRSSDGEMMIFNIPTSPTLETAEQIVLNTLTGAWVQWDIPARTWSAFGDTMMLGMFSQGAAWDDAIWDAVDWGAGGTVSYLSGASDNGSAITATARTAFTHLGQRGRTKDVTQVKPVIRAEGSLTAKIGVDYDYAETPIASQADRTLIASGGASEWDTADWDTADWGGGTRTSDTWVVTTGSGRAVNVYLRVTDSQRINWFGTDVLSTTGGV